MTDKISHALAQIALVDLLRGPSPDDTRPENDAWLTTRGDTLRRYITQQQASESAFSDTVSIAERDAAVLAAVEDVRAEHEAALEALEDGLRTELRGANEELTAQQAEHKRLWDIAQAEHERRLEEQKDALMGAFRRREEEHERVTKLRATEIHVYRRRIANQRTELRNLLKATAVAKAEHERALATERARAEEAESKLRGATHALNELAAASARADAIAEDRRVQRVRAADAEIALTEANARAERLEEALQELANMGSMLWLHVYGGDGGAWVQRGAGYDFSGFEANHVDGKTAADAIVALVEKKPWRSTAPQASTEPASPSPTVGEWKAPVSTGPDHPATASRYLTVQPSPFPQVAQAPLEEQARATVAEAAEFHRKHLEDLDQRGKPAQPAPGATERWVPKTGDRVRNTLNGLLAKVQEQRGGGLVMVLYDGKERAYACASECLEPVPDPTPSPALPVGQGQDGPSNSLRLVRHFLASTEQGTAESAWLAAKELLNWAEELERKANP